MPSASAHWLTLLVSPRGRLMLCRLRPNGASHRNAWRGSSRPSEYSPALSKASGAANRVPLAISRRKGCGPPPALSPQALHSWLPRALFRTRLRPQIGIFRSR